MRSSRVRMSENSRFLRNGHAGRPTVPQEVTPPGTPPKKLPTWKNVKCYFTDHKWAKDALFGTLFTAIIVLAVWTVIPDWVTRRLGENLWFYPIATVALILTAIYLPSKVPFAAIAGRWARLVWIVALVVMIVLPSDYAQAKFKVWRDTMADKFVSWLEGKSSNGSNTTPTGTVSTNNTLLPVSEDGCKEVEKFWRARRSPSQARILTLHARLESGCNQFRPDGSVYRHVGPDGRRSSAMGVMMVLEGVHGERANSLGLDLNTFYGNLRFADELVSERIASGQPFNQDWSETRDEVMAILGETPEAQKISFRFQQNLERVERFTLKPGEWSDHYPEITGSSRLVVIEGKGQFAIPDKLGTNQVMRAEEVPLGPYGPSVAVRNTNDEPGGEPGVDITFEIRRW